MLKNRSCLWNCFVGPHILCVLFSDSVAFEFHVLNDMVLKTNGTLLFLNGIRAFKDLTIMTRDSYNERTPSLQVRRRSMDFDRLIVRSNKTDEIISD